MWQRSRGDFLKESLGQSMRLIKADKMPKKKASSQVPEQFRGFSLQPTRMGMLLLQAPQGSVVSLEQLDDVAQQDPSGSLLVVQTKDTEATNPVTDRSPQMWKTFANWSRDVRARKIDPTRTIFEIYVSRKVGGKLIHRFHEATTKEAIQSAFEEARTKLWGQPPKFSKRSTVADGLKEHLDEVFETGASAFKSILQGFQLTCAIKTPEADLRALVAAIPAIREDLIDEMVVDIHGWLKTLIDQQLRERKAPVIAKSDFVELIRSSYNRLNPSGSLPDLARIGPSASDITTMLGYRFVKQMEIIKHDMDGQNRAMACFFKARTTRTAWARQGVALVHDKSTTEFEENLEQVWRNHKIKVFSDPLRTDEELRGRLLLAECELHSCQVEGKDAPNYFIAGCFHELSDRLAIGWHPRFQDLVPQGAI